MSTKIPRATPVVVVIIIGSVLVAAGLLLAIPRMTRPGSGGTEPAPVFAISPVSEVLSGNQAYYNFTVSTSSANNITIGSLQVSVLASNHRNLTPNANWNVSVHSPSGVFQAYYVFSTATWRGNASVVVDGGSLFSLVVGQSSGLTLAGDYFELIGSGQWFGSAEVSIP